MIRIAIIIPVYNSERYLAECLDSVLRQTYSNWEVYCVNDGSTDSSAKILDAYKIKDSRIKVYHKENGGVSSARNYAIERIQHKDDETWISFLDSDDYVSPTRYEEIVSTLSTVNDPRCGYIRLFCKSVTNRSDMEGHGDGYELLTADKYFATAKVGGLVVNAFVKKSLIDKHKLRFPIDMRFMEDQVFSILCAIESKYIILYKKQTYFYYNNPNSAVHQPINRMNDIVQCINIIYKELHNSNSQDVRQYLHTKFLPSKVEMLLNEIIRYNQPLLVPLNKEIRISQYIKFISLLRLKYYYAKFKQLI